MHQPTFSAERVLPPNHAREFLPSSMSKCANTINLIPSPRFLQCIGSCFAGAQSVIDERKHPESTHVELRRYPNRRYYDCSRSQHLTLDDIYRLVLDGKNVVVKDSKTEEDITARVLTQLILEHDPPKLAAFPVELLHQIIRSNETLLREFVEKYFNRALTAFLKSQREFDRYLGQLLGLYGNSLIGGNWAELVMGPFIRALASDERQLETKAGDGREGQAEGELRQAMAELKQEVAALREKLERR